MDFNRFNALNDNAATGTDIDLGLRAFFNDVFVRMAAALVISALAAFIGSGIPALYTGGLLTWAIILSPLAFVLIMSFGAERLSASTLNLLFVAFAVANGLSMGSLLLVFTATSVVTTFLISASVFCFFAILGYTTRRDLTNLGSFLMVGLVGIIIASLVNIWLALPALAATINVLAVLIFVGLTAYDVQRLKETYYSGEDSGKVRVLGALNLYLNFINIFVNLLQLLGIRKDD